jgi:hypothetical protein
MALGWETSLGEKSSTRRCAAGGGVTGSLHPAWRRVREAMVDRKSLVMVFIRRLSRKIFDMGLTQRLRERIETVYPKV